MLCAFKASCRSIHAQYPSSRPHFTQHMYLMYISQHILNRATRKSAVGFILKRLSMLDTPAQQPVQRANILLGTAATCWTFIRTVRPFHLLSFHTHHVGLDSLAIFRAPFINILPSLIGTNKADRFDGRMIADEIHSCDRETGRVRYNWNDLNP